MRVLTPRFCSFALLQDGFSVLTSSMQSTRDSITALNAAVVSAVETDIPALAHKVGELDTVVCQTAATAANATAHAPELTKRMLGLEKAVEEHREQSRASLHPTTTATLSTATSDATSPKQTPDVSATTTRATDNAGILRCVSRAGATAELDPLMDPDFVAEFEPGQELVILEISQTKDGRRRARTRDGWVSLSAMSGHTLFEVVKTDFATITSESSTSANNGEAAATAAAAKSGGVGAAAASGSADDGDASADDLAQLQMVRQQLRDVISKELSEYEDDVARPSPSRALAPILTSFLVL